MIVQRVSGPATPAISVDDLKSSMRITYAVEDDVLEGMLAAAVRVLEDRTGRVFGAETWSVAMGHASGSVRLPRAPVSSVSSITYFDEDDTEQSASVSDFYLTGGDGYSTLCPKAGVSWPTANQNRDDAIKITFVVGYTSLPENLKRAALMLAGMYEQYRTAGQEKPVSELPFGVDALIEGDRLDWVRA